MSRLKRQSIKKTRLKSGYTVYDVVECTKCGSDNWHSYQRCTLCYAYYTKAKCGKCGHLRMEVCSRDRGDLEFYEPRWKAPSKEQEPRSA
ncbi:MAG: hypothetical protein ACE5KH_03790 [Candidatus Geothermarchaeales archaeon]